MQYLADFPSSQDATQEYLALSTGAEEYTDCFSAER